MVVANVDLAVAAKAAEIKTLPYAKYINAEDGLERNFGYKIVRQQVSAGRNSMIYKCESRKNPELYCIVKAYKLGKDKVKQSLREEVCQIMRYVTGKCPQIISTMDMFYTNEKIYLMCDWTSSGEVLTNLKHRSIKLNEAMLRNWTLDMLNAVNFLHNNAICHRNIAPNCLLLTNEQRVKIGSLSDAVVYCKPDGTVIKQKWPRFQRVGNWNQPPEVAKSKPYDARRADIWSVGATVYWFITKNHPLDYKSGSKLTKQLEHRLGYMRKVSPVCQAFVKKMLTYQPPARPNIKAAMELDWVSGKPPSPSTAGAATSVGGTRAAPTNAEAAAEIEPPGERAEPGEAAGPDDAPETPEASSSTKKPDDGAAAPDAKEEGG